MSLKNPPKYLTRAGNRLGALSRFLGKSLKSTLEKNPFPRESQRDVPRSFLEDFHLLFNSSPKPESILAYCDVFFGNRGFFRLEDEDYQEVDSRVIHTYYHGADQSYEILIGYLDNKEFLVSVA